MADGVTQTERYEMVVETPMSEEVVVPRKIFASLEVQTNKSQLVDTGCLVS